jgi:hypothetical protein
MTVNGFKSIFKCLTSGSSIPQKIVALNISGIGMSDPHFESKPSLGTCRITLDAAAQHAKADWFQEWNLVHDICEKWPKTLMTNCQAARVG